MAAWALLDFTPLGEVFPSVLGGFIMAALGMVAGSIAPTRGNTAHRARIVSHGVHSHGERAAARSSHGQDD
jgi:hypothetical protein